MRRIAILVLFSLVFILTQPKIGFAGATGWRTFGARFGFSDTRNDEDFNQYDGFATYGLPWNFNFDDGWRVGPYLEINAGVLAGGGDTGLVFSVGPGLYLASPPKRLFLNAGVNPSYVSEHTYGREDLGGPIQFTVYIGLSWRFYRAWGVDCRLQHMSNAGIYTENPGINQHMFGLTYHF